MITIVPLVVAAVATAATWLVLSTVVSVFGGVGIVEALLLLVPAIVAGAQARTRTARALTTVRKERV